ncbi:hypothetical protein HanXRQr2_Chr08g0339191 [Helianthus annuus]|uniref:Uncharacterized protein n=1 Tax=Helianthus annuus TaxID=4232 RepID=A0A9K3IEH9_HELAN|nr:hypothetical protein HanXRQr2_Chr08g0339191 [Helianthus annuus]KAJ0538905.1 hypothetical protein HanHA300_Chr08g0280261 [Helianthus annuus]KAJ0546939.1 hypothetical protein HanIR_Chr08g0366511 [Helianthus annuus]KAJ0722447.1 hypothetical protein HanOQP8_Chr08g0286761 [Helianthus annuus]
MFFFRVCDALLRRWLLAICELFVIRLVRMTRCCTRLLGLSLCVYDAMLRHTNLEVKVTTHRNL